MNESFIHEQEVFRQNQQINASFYSRKYIELLFHDESYIIDKTLIMPLQVKEETQVNNCFIIFYWSV